jgi:DNA integrity scanning protein DisA with diadenylate cyclase activity
MPANKTSPTDVVTYTPPGISWTAPEKSRPWQQPPRYVKVSDVANMYVQLISSEETANEMLDSLETKVPLSSIAESLMLGGVANGMHTIDAGILVMPVIMEMLQTIATFNKIKTVMYADEYDKASSVPNRVAMMAVKQAVSKLEPKEQEEEPMVKAGGLMSRKNKEVK